MGFFGTLVGGILQAAGAFTSAATGGLAAPLGGLLSGWGNGLMQSSQMSNQRQAVEQYNSPQAQMARYKAAGLNPNLIYTQGNTYSAPASVADFDSTGNVSGVDYQTKVANLDNVQQMIKVAAADAALKASQTTLAGTQSDLAQQQTWNAGQEFDFKNSTYGADVTAADLQNKLTIANISRFNAIAGMDVATGKSVADEDARQQALAAPNLQIALENAVKAHFDAIGSAVDVDQKNAVLSFLNTTQYLRNIKPTDDSFLPVMESMLHNLME